MITSTREEHKHSNNSVAHPKSGMIEYFAQGAAQTFQQLGRLQQERYDRLRRPRRGTNTPTTRSPTPRAVRSTTSPKERHNQQKQLGRLLQEQYNRPLHPKSGTSNNYNSGAYPQNYPASRMTQIYSTNQSITPRKSIINLFSSTRSPRRNKLWQSTKKSQGKTGQNLSILFKDI